MAALWIFSTSLFDAMANAATSPSSVSMGGPPNYADNLMAQSVDIRLRNLRGAPRCGARTRAGSPCQLPALCGRARCKLHGGLSPGAPKGSHNGNFVDGAWTAEAIEERRWAKELLRRLVDRE
jgi:hypothetical protein